MNEAGGLHMWVFMKSHDRALVVSLIALVSSVVGCWCPPPESFFSDPRNFFNRIVLKAGWGITMAVCTSLLALVSFVLFPKWLRRRNLAVIRGPAIRMAMGTAWWYIVTTTFDWFRDTSGACSVDGMSSYRQCRSAGGLWNGFDASGHSFLLGFNCLVLAEEVQALSVCHTLRRLTKGRASDDLAHAHTAFDNLKVGFSLYFLVIGFLQAFNTFMLMLTCLYFHTFVEKLVGLLTAGIGWFLIYSLFCSKWGVSPGVDQLSPSLKDILEKRPSS